MAEQDLPLSLHDRVVKARHVHVSRLAILLQKQFPHGIPANVDLKGLVEALTLLADDSLREIALEAYREGVAKAGEAQQALQDLETLRCAARILLKGAR